MNSGHAPYNRVVAVLGPTNTGKTHFAVERMLAHRSGMMGFPLRLLAREIYDRVVAIKGPRHVALVTGEEKIGPDQAQYVIATVEAMPIGRQVEFLAVDEIQLAADPSRGHVFTDRLLNARGTCETMFMGSLTAERQLRRLVPGFELITRPRFSALSYTGTTKLSRLPRRSAVVAFTANDVYALAELVRRQHGGAAVVLGALSPRTRNAQVEMYQSGEVDHLVATDAIGMGLNMDLAHVTFAKLHKFDGRNERFLHAPEIGQIAGRAGRHMANGTFSVARGAGELESRIVDAVENHSFAPLRTFRWRNNQLDFSSLAALQASLDAPPPAETLIKMRDALDDRSLSMLSADHEVRKRASDPGTVRLLWQVCQIPDFRKTLTGAHMHLLKTVFEQIADDGRLRNDWVATMVSRLEEVEGEIDALLSRLSHIRTWTYLSHRDQWFDDPDYWQARTRSVEDRLSDALHERLTQRFVDRRTAALMRSIRERGDVIASINKNHEILVDGHHIGKLEGLQLAVAGTDASDTNLLASAVRKAAKRPLIERAAAILEADDETMTLDDRDRIVWEDAVVGSLAPGSSLLKPKIRVIADDVLPGRLRMRVEERLKTWFDKTVGSALSSLLAIEKALGEKQTTAAERSILFQLCEQLGSAHRKGLSVFIRQLDPSARFRMTRLGVRFGLDYIYVEGLLKKAPIEMRLRLLRVAGNNGLVLSPPGLSVIRGIENWRSEHLHAIGYHKFESFALRQDMFERLAAGFRARSKETGNFPLPVELAPEVGISRSELEHAILAMGYREGEGEEGKTFFCRKPSKSSKRRKRQRGKKADNVNTDSPFAALRELYLAT